MGVTTSIQRDFPGRWIKCYYQRCDMHSVWRRRVYRARVYRGRKLVSIALHHVVQLKLTSNHSLFLDVWVPKNANSTSNLPVKVWIHGGGEQGGGTQNPIFDGCNLAAHDTLVVSISYRLGPLGFLTLASAGISGNFGIQDILLGLEWVQSHIAAFGGNPVCFSTPSRVPWIMLTIRDRAKLSCSDSLPEL